MGSTVDGLVSGMDTTAMIASMMQIEAAPQTLLKNKVSTAQTAVSSYQSVNAKLAALKTAADDLSQLSTWRSIKPTVSSSAVTATAIGGVSTGTGSVTFDVVSLAKVQGNTARVASAGDITAADSIQVSIGSADPVIIDISADKTAAGVAAAINKAGIAVKASLVETNAGDSVMTLSGTKTGASNSFAIAGMDDVAMHVVTPASSALIQVGGADVDGGFGMTSDTNTFTGLMPGVSMTVSKIEADVTLSSASDVSGIAAKFAALVAAANNTLTEVGNQTAYDSGTNAGSPLTGDFTVRQMSQSILSAISQGLNYSDDTTDAAGTVISSTPVNFGSLSKFGVQLDKTGQLTFDADKFTAAYNADPTAIKKAGTAFADQFEALATKQSATVAATITSRSGQIDSLTDQIGNWDVRLASRQSALNRQYASLETALGKLKDQSTWLSGQIAGLS